MPECDRQTDGRTDRRTECYINIARQHYCADARRYLLESEAGEKQRARQSVCLSVCLRVRRLLLLF